MPAPAPAVVEQRRRLVAIVVADVVGYSRLMGRDEGGTLRRLKAHQRELLEPLVTAHGGRVVNFAGDSVLCEFASAVAAVRCAAALQGGIEEREAGVPEAERIRLRVGVNLGDVIDEGGEIFGDGINVAARLQALAEPGGVAVSGSVRDSVKGKLDLAFAPRGDHRVKNIADPVEVWRVVAKPGRRAAPTSRWALPAKVAAVAVAAAAALAALVVVLGPSRLGPDGPGGAATPALTRSQAPAPPPGVDRPSVAVLPFASAGGGADGGAALAAGLAEDILTELSRNRDLRVIARDSSFALAGQDLPPAEVGRRLGVGYVLAGSARRAGEELRINVRLVDSASGDHVWADRFAVGAEEVYAAQDEIVREITGRLASEVRESEKATALRRPPGSLDVYELTLRGLALKHRLDRDSLLAARAILGEAAGLDPGYAPAQLYLGQVDALDIGSGGITGRYGLADLPEVIARIRRAVELDPGLPAGYRILSQALGRHGDAEGALQAAIRSVELAPSNADNLNFLAVAQVRVGRYAEAAENISKALDLNPLAPAWYHAYRAQALYALGRHDEALADAEACAVRSPAWVTCHLARAAAAQEAGRAEEAGASVRELLSLNPHYSTATAEALTPYTRDAALTERYVRDLREAGLPEPAMAGGLPAGGEGTALGAPVPLADPGAAQRF